MGEDTNSEVGFGVILGFGVLIVFFWGAFALTSGETLNSEVWKCTEWGNEQEASVGFQKYQSCTQYTRKTEDEINTKRKIK